MWRLNKIKICNWCEKAIKGKQHVQVQIIDLIKGDEKTGETEGRWNTYSMHEDDCLDNFIGIVKKVCEKTVPINGYRPEFVYVQYRKRNMLAKSHWNGTLKEYCLKPESWKKIKDVIKEFDAEELERIIKNVRIEPEEYEVKRLKPMLKNEEKVE